MSEAEIRERLAYAEQDMKSVHRRLDTLEGLVESVHTIATETKAMREDMNGLNVRVAEIEKKPSKRLDGIVNIIMTAVVSGLAGYFVKLWSQG